MKKLLSSSWPALVVLTMSSGAAWAAAPVGTVRTATGKTWFRTKTGAAQSALARRTPLYVGNVVGTGANGKLTLLWSDGAQVRLGENSSIEVTAPRPMGNGKRSLFRALGGRVWARLRPNNAIETRTVALGVRGTEIHLDVAADDGTTALVVVEGQVEFFNKFGSVLVNTSQRSIARPGLAPTAPVTVQNGNLITEWTSSLDRAAVAREKFWISLDPRVVAPELARRQARAQAAPTDAAALASYGDALFDAHRYQEALANYQAADELARGPQTLTRLGYVLLELDRLDEAGSAFAAAAKSDAKLVQIADDGGAPAAAYAPALTGLAWLQLQRDRPDEAQLAAQSALALPFQTAALGAENDEARLALGVALLRQPTKRDAGLKALREVASRPSEVSYAAHAWLALALLDENDVAGAVRQGETAVKLQPYSALAHGNLALANFFAGDGVASQRNARRAVALDPDSSAARVALGQALLLRGDADGAAREAAQAVALDPKLPQAYYLLGVANAGRRDYSHAHRDLERALELSPDFLPAASGLARVYNLMGEPEKARQAVNVVLERNPNSDAALGALGAVYYEQGDYRGAEARQRQAIERNPNSALYQAELARTLTYSNKLNAAIEAGPAAVRLAPEVGQYHAVLGMALGFARLEAQSEREFRTALIYDPANALAMAQLALRSGNSDLRPSSASLTQAFIQDPAIAQQLLRGGINTELTPQGGSRGANTVGLTQRITADEGKFNSLSLFNRAAGAGTRDNDDLQGYSTGQFLTYAPSPRTNIGVVLRAVSTQNGLRGPDSRPDNDDRARTRGADLGLAVRQRLSANSDLWVGVRGAQQRNTVRDPGGNSFGVAGSDLNIARQDVESNGLLPELRYDLKVGRGTSKAGTFTFGLARARTKFDLSGELPLPVAGQSGRLFGDETTVTNLAYGQYAGRFGSKFSLIGQLRVQRNERSQNGGSTILSQTQLAPGITDNQTHVLPSFLANYQADARTAVRFSFNKRVLDATTSAFAPNETLLITQRGAVPYGVPQTLQLAQVDVERYVGKSAFVRLFAFASSADDVVVGGPDFQGFGQGLPSPSAPLLALSGWRGSGFGARAENRLGRNWFLNGGLVSRSVSANGYGNSAPYEPKLLGDLSLQYLSNSGNKVGLRVRHTGSFLGGLSAGGARSNFGSTNAVDLLLAREGSSRQELFFNVTNIFNTRQFAFEDYRTGQRNIEFGVTRRF